jgi:glycosyltransferase involved in cell wall biosynthesis
MSHPLVSILCLCYNHEDFVAAAIQSVLNQTYPSIQLIIVDDGSTDGSASVIRGFLKENPATTFIHNLENKGYTKALNQALQKVSGEFIVDLAADDILLPTRVEEGVAALLAMGSKYGVHFSDAELIDSNAKSLGLHSAKHPHEHIPQGDVYVDIIQRYFICPPTMLFRTSVIEQLGGYDEALFFEDFDFFIRASREFHFCYSPNVLVKRRVLSDSMSAKQFQSGNEQRWSTLRVCEKINQLNKSDKEVSALKKRIRYEFLLSIRMRDFKLAKAFLRLYFRLSSPNRMLT